MDERSFSRASSYDDYAHRPPRQKASPYKKKITDFFPMTDCKTRRMRARRVVRTRSRQQNRSGEFPAERLFFPNVVVPTLNATVDCQSLFTRLVDMPYYVFAPGYVYRGMSNVHDYSTRLKRAHRNCTVARFCRFHRVDRFVFYAVFSAARREIQHRDTDRALSVFRAVRWRPSNAWLRSRTREVVARRSRRPCSRWLKRTRFPWRDGRERLAQRLRVWTRLAKTVLTGAGAVASRVRIVLSLCYVEGTSGRRRKRKTRGNRGQMGRDRSAASEIGRSRITLGKR